jgi:hypothetical protein
MPEGMERVELLGMPWRNARLHIEVNASPVGRIMLDDQPLEGGILPPDLCGEHRISIS